MEEAWDNSELTALDLYTPAVTTVDSTGQPFPLQRRICLGCDRPISICLCSALPSEPIETRTQILILHHPHETRHKLATVPVLSKCLRRSQTIVGRRLHLGSSPLLDSLYNSSLHNPHHSPRAIYLFPSTHSSPSIPISQLKPSYFLNTTLTDIVLILFDGTWKHAKEMVSASLPFLSKFAVRVCLECDHSVDGRSIYDSELILRKEPFSGCVSTMEAVAHALCVIEPNGMEIEGHLVEVLRAMVRFQACNLKPLKPRPKMVKKNKRI